MHDTEFACLQLAYKLMTVNIHRGAH